MQNRKICFNLKDSFIIKILPLLMKRIKLLILISTVIPLLLNGCLNYEQITTVKADKSGKMFIHYWTKITLPTDSTILRKVALFDTSAIRKKISKNFIRVENVEAYTDNEDSTVHIKIEFFFSNLDSLNKLEIFKSSNIHITDAPGGLKKFTQTVTPVIYGLGIDTENYTLKYVYYLPGKIYSSNANDVTLNRLTWQFKMSEVKNGLTLSATYKPFKLAETPPWIYWLAGIVLLIVLIFLFKKKEG
jgi:hypothetical protein